MRDAKPLHRITKHYSQRTMRPRVLAAAQLRALGTSRPAMLTAAVFLFLCTCLAAVELAAADGPPKSLVRRCNKGDAESCYAAGLNQLTKNPSLGQQFLAKGCGLGSREGCKWLHDASTELMEGDTQAQQRAVAHFEIACKQRYGRSCTSLGSALWSGKGAAVDQARALELWLAGCERRSRVGCRRAGSAFEDGKVVSKDLARALQLYDKSCDLELEHACADAGRLLAAGVGANSGEPSTAESHKAQAVEPLRKACFEARVRMVQGDACLRLGRLLAGGQGVEPNAADAYEAFRRGCAENVAESCLEAGRVLLAGKGVQANANYAVQMFGKGCRLKLPEACRQLCRHECDMGQPYACERLESERWPMHASCSMSPVASGGP